MALILKALIFGVLTDMHGDIPCADACKGLENLQPKLDTQESVYFDCIFPSLDSAIKNLLEAKADKMENAERQDILFANDIDSWIAFAYGLKARYLLHTSYRNPAVYADVIAAVNNAITYGFDGADLSVFNGDDTDNPWWAYYYSREYTGCTTTVSNLMTAKNDPRLDVYAFPYWFYGEAEEQICAPGNEEFAKQTGGLSQPAWLSYRRTSYDPGAANRGGGAASIHLLSKSELYFILAEAQAQTGVSAQEAFETAVKASFADFEKFSPKALDASTFLANFSTVTLEDIMTQKYISQVRDEQIEAYNDIRRYKAMGKEIITLTNPFNTQGGQNYWPFRLPYGNSSVISNPNINSAFNSVDIFRDQVWLFGGSN